MTHVSDDELHNGQLLGIGEASQLCGITSRTLRHYDKLNLLQPDCIGDNKYRYYSLETILRIPIINYLKMMGFSLDEVSELFETQSFGKIKEMLGAHADACTREMTRLEECRHTIRDWMGLIDEANFVLSVKPRDVSLMYFSGQEFLAMPYHFWGNYADAIINLDFTSFVEEHDNVITGPVILYHSSFDACCEPDHTQKHSEVTVVQHALRPIAEENRMTLKSGMYLSTYHTGPFENIGEAHRRVRDYALANGFKPADGVFERFVADYWTTYDQDLFVAEVLLPVER